MSEKKKEIKELKANIEEAERYLEKKMSRLDYLKEIAGNNGILKKAIVKAKMEATGLWSKGDDVFWRALGKELKINPRLFSYYRKATDINEIALDIPYYEKKCWDLEKDDEDKDTNDIPVHSLMSWKKLTYVCDVCGKEMIKEFRYVKNTPFTKPAPIYACLHCKHGRAELVEED